MMADAKAYSRIEEIEVVEKAEEVKEEEVNTDESKIEKWSMLNTSNEQSDNESSQSQETQENWIIVNRDAVSKNDNVLPKDNDLSNDCNRISKIEENLDVSDSISVITESSDTDSNNQISRVNDSFQVNSASQDRSRLSTLERQRDARSNHIAYTLGLLSIIIGFFFYHPFTIPEAFQASNGIDKESFKVATYNIDNIYKELPQVKAMLSEIRGRILDDTKIRQNFLVQLSEIIDSSNKMSNEPIMAVKESFSSNSYPLDQLQVSLHVLSSLAFINDNIPLKNEMTKTLDTVNNTKVFYETLTSFNNDAQNNSAVLEFLQSGNDIIHTTSEQLLFDLMEKMNKVISNVHKKYAKVEQKLSKKLCHLKNILPDDELLKQLTENNQFFKNYDKSCFSKHNLKKLNDKRNGAESANNIKQQIRKADNTVLRTKHNKKNIQKLYNDRENSLKNERNGTQHISNSTVNSKKINVHSNYNKIKDKLYEVLSYLEDIRSDSSKVEQLTKNYEEQSKKSINRSEEKDLSENNTLIIKQQLHDMITSETVPDHTTENYNININIKHKINDTKTASGNSANIFTEEERLKEKSKYSNKNNDENAYNEEKDKMKNHIPKYESKQFSFNKGSDARKKQWQSDASDWYFERADSRKNARKNVEYQRNWYFQRVDSRKNARNYAEYRRNSERLRRKKRHPYRIVTVWNRFVYNYNKFLRSIFSKKCNLI